MPPNGQIKQKIIAFLKQHNRLVLATASQTGRPHAATVFYLADDAGNLFLITGEETTKYQNIEENLEVAFVVGTGPDIVTVQGTGRVAWTAKGKKEIFRILGKHFDLNAAPAWPPLAVPHRGLVLIKIKPSRVMMLDLTNGAKTVRYGKNSYRIADF